MILGKCQILVVEDNEHHAELIRTAFLLSGCKSEIVTTSSVEEAILYLRSGPDNRASRSQTAVLSDLNLQPMNGLDLIDIMKNDPDLEELSVSIFTTSRNSEDRSNALARGADRYIVKPPNFEEFCVTVKYLDAILRFEMEQHRM